MFGGERRGAYLALLVTMVSFGGTWPAGKVAAEHVEPATAAVCRFASAAALLWVWARLSGRPVPRPRRRDLPLVAVLGFTVVFAYNLFFLYGVRHAPATDGAVLVPGLIPVVTTLLAWPVLGERLSRRTALGLVVAVAGVVVVADPVGGVGSGRLAGDGLFVGAAVSWSTYTLAGRSAIARFGSVNANIYATGVGALLLLPVSFLGGGWRSLAAAPVQAWGSIAYLSLAGTVLGFVLFYEGVRVIGASRAASFALLVPVFGVLSSVLVLGERLRPLLALGGAIVFVGLWLVQTSGRTEAVPDVPARDTRLDEPRPGL
ncbi:MAG TPA: DMT family transporter [Gaiellaceae bacterium]|nr:DMT family transporter [Gaiellaceae bacterium]